MKNLIVISILALIAIPLNSTQLYTCIKDSFTGNCKTKLYECTNNPQCSYQLHENTQHIFLNEQSDVFPALYFSNLIARNLYECLKNECKLPQIDQEYPKTLPFDYCLIEVYDICRGNIEQIYSNPRSTSAQAQCYRKYCRFPQLQSQ